MATSKGIAAYVKNSISNAKIDPSQIAELSGYEKKADAAAAHSSLQANIDQMSTGKQDKLTFDTTPTANSNNPVTSKGIKAALDNTLEKTGNAATATKATQDGNGNNIANTYETIAAASDAHTSLQNDINSLRNDIKTQGGVNSQGSNWIRYESGLQLCWTDWIAAQRWWTFPQAFKDTPAVTLTCKGAEWPYIYGLSKTGCQNKGATGACGIAVGRWK